MKKKLRTDQLNSSKTFSFEDNLVLPMIYGESDKFLKTIEKNLDIEAITRGNIIKLNGAEENINLAQKILENLYNLALKNNEIDEGEIFGLVNMAKNSLSSKVDLDVEQIESLCFKAGRKLIKPRTKKQADYFNLIKKYQMVFCCGPAGTGKTYLAVAFAVWMLKTGQIEKISLTRPAVEAGERLGFLPGDLKEKIDPYLRPIYDALNDMLSFSEVLKKIDAGFIEIAPLAFMRGRTLSNAFIILDESQNTTAVQMKMFLTRLGENSKMIINGDLSQVDLPSGTKSGLRESINILNDVKEIGFIRFNEKDVVRNPLVSKIVSKYEGFEKSEGVGKEYISKYKKNDRG